MDWVVILSSSLCQFLSGAFSLGILCFFIEDTILTEMIKGIMGLMVYIRAMNSLVLVLSSWIKDEQVWLGIIPILSIASVIFCPVVLDLSTMQSGLRYGSYLFLPYYYLKEKYEILITVALMSMMMYTFIHKRKSLKRNPLKNEL